MVRAEDGKLHSHLEWPNIAEEDGLKLSRTEKDTEYYSSQELHILSAVIDMKLNSMIYVWEIWLEIRI